MSFWRTVPCIIMLFSSSSLLTFLVLRSALSEINMTTFTFWWLVLTWHIFLHRFTSNLYVCLYLKWNSYSWLLFFDSLWQTLFFFNRVFKTLTFTTIADTIIDRDTDLFDILIQIKIYHIYYCFLFIFLIFIPIFAFTLFLMVFEYYYLIPFSFL